MVVKKKYNDIKDEKETSKEATSMHYAFILSCFFISGLTGLVYEILWTRLIVKIIGSAPFAVSIVLTVFMAGLGLGSYIASRTIDSIKKRYNLVTLYGILEIIIGVYGLMLPLFLLLFRPLYSILYNHFFGHFILYTIFTFTGCAILLLLPATCMGATLPVLSRFYVTKMSHVGTHLGHLYSLNTMGAVAGTLLCGFWIINLWGVQGSLLFAVILNAIIGTTCILLSLTLKTYTTRPGKMRADSTISPENGISRNAKISGMGALVIFAVSGFCAMAYEVIWTKLLGLIVGPTTYSFTIVLITFISGLALGSMFFGWMADIVRKPISLLLFSQIFAALFALWVSQIMGNSQIFFAKLIFHFKDNFSQLVFLKSLILFMFMFLPTFFLGSTFPLVGKIYTNSLSHIGRSIGFAYSINTVGAVLGSFCAGFVLIPLIGKETSLSLIVTLQLMVSFAIGSIIFWKTRKRVREWIPFTLLVVCGITLAFIYPRWDREMLSTGKYHRYEEPEMTTMGWLMALLYGNDVFADYQSGELVYFGDGIGGFTTVKKDTDTIGNINYSLLNSGKSDASTVGGDMGTQTLLAHFPMLFHPNPENVMVLGLASGITAGEVLHYPVRKLDVIDINNQVVKASDFFTPWNNNVLSDPRTELIIQDGRAHLELTNRSYDVIISEPSNPWMAGLATLFTDEFFELVRKRLNPDGIFVQWIHAYQIDWNNFALVGRTFAQIFPNSLLVSVELTEHSADYLLVGFNGENGLSIDTAARNLSYAQKSHNMKLPNHTLFYNLIKSEDLQKLFGKGYINTDNHPMLEFAAPKLLHFYDPTMAENIVSKKWLSKETERIIQEFSSDVDAQIDIAVYYLSFNEPYQKIVDITKATPLQRERFYNLMETYCAGNYVTDFSFINDEELKKKCISTQIEFMLDKLNSVPEKAPLYFHLGDLYYENGMLDEAITSYSKVLEIDPEVDVVHYNIGKILSVQEKFDEAAHHYQEAVRINPEYVLAMNNLGNILVREGKINEAVSLYRKALSIDNEFSLAHKNLGIVLKESGKTEEGEAHIQEALRLEQKSATFNSLHN